MEINANKRGEITFLSLKGKLDSVTSLNLEDKVLRLIDDDN